MDEKRRRIHMLDELRGFAIVCMVFHHTFLDIGDVLGLEWGYRAFDFLCNFQPFFWAIFIVISGMCTRLSRNAVKRGALVFACGMAVTVFTAVILPIFKITGAEIFFGILHCLGICMIVTGLLLKVFDKIDYRVGAIVSLAIFFFLYGIDNGTLAFGLIQAPSELYKTNLFAWLGFHTAGFYSADYFPVLPWIFMFFSGAFFGKLAKENLLPQAMYVKRSKFLSFMGKNSLWVYMAHQPILYGILLLISLVIA